jgi:hypothetical protein
VGEPQELGEIQVGPVAQADFQAWVAQPDAPAAPDDFVLGAPEALVEPQALDGFVVLGASQVLGELRASSDGFVVLAASQVLDEPAEQVAVVEALDEYSLGCWGDFQP